MCEGEAEMKRTERVEGGVLADESHTVKTSQPSFKIAAAAALNEASQALYHTTNTLLSSYRELHKHLTSTKTTLSEDAAHCFLFTELIISSLTKCGCESPMKSVSSSLKFGFISPQNQKKEI